VVRVSKVALRSVRVWFKGKPERWAPTIASSMVLLILGEYAEVIFDSRFF
jgi:hypothetical protein